MLGGLYPHQSPGSIIEINIKDAEKQIKSLETEIKKEVFQVFYYQISKILRSTLEGLWVQQNGVDNLK
jgi:hypothetical protein